MPKKVADRLMSFPAGKKIAFLMFLYERMISALSSFCFAEGLDFSVFQKARDEFWRSLMSGVTPIEWTRLRDDILKATPDSEDYGSEEASFALNAALVAAGIAGFLADGQDAHVVEAMAHALNSLGAYVINEMGAVVYDRTINDSVKAHALVRKEAWKEEEDVAFLSAIQDTPWPEEVFAIVRRRSETQASLLDCV